jgi:hypothetical protein
MRQSSRSRLGPALLTRPSFRPTITTPWQSLSASSMSSSRKTATATSSRGFRPFLAATRRPVLTTSSPSAFVRRSSFASRWGEPRRPNWTSSESSALPSRRDPASETDRQGTGRRPRARGLRGHPFKGKPPLPEARGWQGHGRARSCPRDDRHRTPPSHPERLRNRARGVPAPTERPIARSRISARRCREEAAA